MKEIKNLFLVCFLFAGCMFMLPGIGWAQEISMPAIFADQMVLQRGQKVPVWGTTDPGATVEVQFAGQKKTTKANSKGEWRVELDPMQASAESRVLTIFANYGNEHAELKIDDVLVGEVWLAGGQSNMYRPFRMLTYEAREPKYEPIAEYLRNEENTANDTLSRQYRVGIDYSVLEEKTEGRGSWSKAVKGPVHNFGATGYFFGRELRRKLNVPVAIIACNLGGTKIEPWIPMRAYQSNDTLRNFYKEEIDGYKKDIASWDQEEVDRAFEKEMAEWEKNAEKARENNENEPNKPRKQVHPDRNKQIASTLYNGMVRPIIPYAIRGAIWYQGESNGNNLPEQYAMRLTAMVDAWREAWGSDFYFYYCQLANYRDANEQPLDETDGWVIVQDQMRLAMRIPKSGMAVLNDIGEAKDIHPKNKIDTGKRLSLWALKQVYGEDIVCSGPVYKKSKVKRNKMIITFDHVGSGLMVGEKNLMDATIEVDEPLQRLQICGADRQWKWAEAKIIAKNKVAVWHSDISNPVEVRYAWSSNPEGANLYNKEGLPTSAFKTSDVY